ncbi:hypothetical protein C0J52_10020 [Blattella germanica]|nr:hypothetical protein C0J52_10020 [Blattella germanica]
MCCLFDSVCLGVCIFHKPGALDRRFTQDMVSEQCTSGMFSQMWMKWTDSTFCMRGCRAAQFVTGMEYKLVGDSGYGVVILR